MEDSFSNKAQCTLTTGCNDHGDIAQMDRAAAS